MDDSQQPLLDKFYALENLVRVEITMKDADWTALATTEHRWGWRRTASIPQAKDDNPPRFDYFNATSVTISGSNFPTKTSFGSVGIIKKSFAGSKSTIKPSIKLKFGWTPSNASKADSDAAKQTKSQIDDLIGTHHLTFNNCVQDSSYIRQPLGYQIFRQGGIPAPRCNFARVIVRGSSQGLTDKPLFSGLYVNLEQAREQFLRRNFAGNDSGNLYETEWGFDLNPKYFANAQNEHDVYPDIKKDQRKNYDYNGVSKYTDQKDLYLASTELTKCVAAKDLTSAKKLIDWNQFLLVTAMQTLVQHWDGYPNNTLVYNDVSAVSDPTVADIKLKLIPGGIDQILGGSHKPFEVKNQGLLTDLLFMNDDTSKELKAAIQICADTFATNLNSNIKMVKYMADLVESELTDSDIPTSKGKLMQEVNNVLDAMNNVNDKNSGIPDLLAHWPRTNDRDPNEFANY